MQSQVADLCKEPRCTHPPVSRPKLVLQDASAFKDLFTESAEGDEANGSHGSHGDPTYMLGAAVDAVVDGAFSPEHPSRSRARAVQVIEVGAYTKLLSGQDVLLGTDELLRAVYKAFREGKDYALLYKAFPDRRGDWKGHVLRRTKEDQYIIRVFTRSGPMIESIREDEFTTDFFEQHFRPATKFEIDESKMSGRDTKRSRASSRNSSQSSSQLGSQLSSEVASKVASVLTTPVRKSDPTSTAAGESAPAAHRRARASPVHLLAPVAEEGALDAARSRAAEEQAEATGVTVRAYLHTCTLNRHANLLCQSRPVCEIVPFCETVPFREVL